MITSFSASTSGKGLYDITSGINKVIKNNNIHEGLCTLLIRHTSASLLIQENADPSAKRDLENWLERLVPENDPIYTHTLECADDMPAHIKSMLTQSTLSIPVQHGNLMLGIWQGIYLFEHRNGKNQREISIHLSSD